MKQKLLLAATAALFALSIAFVFTSDARGG